ncbi:RNA 2',3'-cyclic phosphodiesterase [Pseudooceanicola sp. 502str34]
MRLFLALQLPEAAQDELDRVMSDLGAGRLMLPETYHITLSFLGDQTEDAAEAVHEEMEGLAFDPFPLALESFGTFGDSPFVLWAGVGESAALTALQRQVAGAVRRAGVETERRRFRPHVTAARFRKRMGPDEAMALDLFLARNAAFRGTPFVVDHVAFVQSTRLSDRAVHEVLARYPDGDELDGG